MKVLFVIGQFNPVIGGAEKQAERLGRALQSQGHEMYVLTGRPKGTKCFEETDGVQVHRIRAWGFRKLKMFLLGVSIAFKIIFKFPDLDIVHIHQANYIAFFAVFAARIRKKPSLLKIGNSGPGFDLISLQKNFRLTGKFMSKFIIKYTNLFVCINQAISETLKQNGVEEDRLVQIPNGIQMPGKEWPETMKGMRTELNLPLDIPVFINVGGLRPNKNQITLLNMMKVLKDHQVRSLLLLIGEGPMRAPIETKIRELGLEEEVKILGWKKDPEKYLQAANAFLLPSKAEGISNALLEALSYGVPSMVSKIPGNEALIIDGVNGYFMDFNDPLRSGEILLHLVNHAGACRAISKYARRFVEETYSMDKVAGQYKEVYGKLRNLAETPRRREDK